MADDSGSGFLSEFFRSLVEENRPAEEIAGGLAKAVTQRPELIQAAPGLASGTLVPTTFRKPELFMPFELDRFSHQAAGVWASLSPQTRHSLYSFATAISAGNQAVVLLDMFQIIRGLAMLPAMLNKLQETSNEILRVQKEVNQKLDEVLSQLEVIQNKLDEQYLVTCRRGFAHLVTGWNTENMQIREQQFSAANSDFTTLTQLNPGGVMKGSSGKVTNGRLIALGYYGNTFIFKMLGDERTAITQIYTCGTVCPEYAVEIFEPEYFTHSYRKSMDEITKEMADITVRYARKMASYESSKRYYEKKSPAKQVGKALGGLAGGLFLTGLGLAGFGALLGLRGLRELKEIPEKPVPVDFAPTKEKLDALKKEKELICEMIREESRIRLGGMQKLSSDELIKISHLSQDPGSLPL